MEYIIVDYSEKGGGIVCNLYWLSRVAGTTTVTPVESNCGFLKV